MSQKEKDGVVTTKFTIILILVSLRCLRWSILKVLRRGILTCLPRATLCVFREMIVNVFMVKDEKYNAKDVAFLSYFIVREVNLSRSFLYIRYNVYFSSRIFYPEKFVYLTCWLVSSLLKKWRHFNFHDLEVRVVQLTTGNFFFAQHTGTPPRFVPYNPNIIPAKYSRFPTI